MDPVSQAALGAVVGQAAGHRRLGYRAAVVGALAGALPDLDVFFAVGGDYFDQLVVHRGITHSLFFAPVAGPLLGALVWRWERWRSTADSGGGRLGAWMWVVALALFSHPLLDYLTPYGTQLLQPFSSARFAINAMPIIDPAYTLLLAAGLVIASRSRPDGVRRIAVATLAVSCAYLGYGWYLNTAAESLARQQLAAAGVNADVAAFPTVLQVHYRRVVARTADADRVGFVSMWRPCRIDWNEAPRIHRDASPVQSFLATREGAIFDWFSMGWARFVVTPQRVEAIDLRYGFTDDPDRSIFTASAPRHHGALGPVRAGRESVDGMEGRLATLFRRTYAPGCAPVAH